MTNGRRPFLALLVASGGFVIVLDSFAAALAFPRIVEDFPDTPRTTLAWVSSGYAIGLAALLLVAGKLGDRYGLRRTYLTGMVGFLIGAVASACTPTPALLIAARIGQGCFGALMVSTSIALALLGYPPQRRGAAMGAIGILGSLASIAGPVLAGTIIDVGGSWRWVFLVSVPIGLAVLAAGRLLPPGHGNSSVSTRIDMPGVVTVVAGSALLTLGLLQSGPWGWADHRTIGVLTGAGLSWALFVRRCRTASDPLLRLEIFERRTFLVATVSQLGSQLSIFAIFFWLPLFLTNVWGWSASATGWAAAVPLVVSFTSLPIGRFADRRGYRGVLVLGGVLGALASLWFMVVAGEEPRFAAVMLPALVVLGGAIGLVGITAASAALAGLAMAELAAANSVFQTSRRLVQTLGIAVVIGLLGDRTSDSLPRFRTVWVVCAACFALSSVVAAWYPAGRRTLEPAEALR